MRQEANDVTAAKEFLSSYQLCLDMLDLRKYERKRLKRQEEGCACEDILAGDEAYWRVRMYEVHSLLSRMKNGREKLMLYYHYVKSESVERAASLLGVSRRTGYRLHARGLLMAAHLLSRDAH